MKWLDKISLTTWIMISMIIGAAIGHFFPEGSQELKVLSNIFMRLIKVIIVPLLFATLVVGIAGNSNDLKSIGRFAFRTFIYFTSGTVIALIIGLVAVNLTQPGVGVNLKVAAESGIDVPKTQMTVSGFLEHLVPKSFIEAAYNNDVLQVVVFTILFAIALTQVSGKPKETIINFCEGLSEVMFKFTGIVMKFAPLGIGAAIAYTVGHSGIEILYNLGKLVLTLYGALIVFVLVMFIPSMIIFKINIKKFFRYVKEPTLIAFSTTSSDAALPTAIEKMVQFGVPRKIVSFVIPTGYSFNLDGSTLYLAIASVFVAQAAGIEMTLWQQITMMLTLMITTKGIAAVPRASLVVLSGTLAAFGLPLEGIAIILGVDELMDMARTSVNLMGNCLASAVMASWEGELAD